MQETSLAAMVQDPHFKDLLRKKTSNDRAAIKEALKLAQLEIDAKTPLYEGCDPEHTRLHVTLKLLNIKEKFKSTDASLNATLEYLHKVLPKGNLLPHSVDEAKKIVCPLDLPHVRYHACINDCIIYRNEHEHKTECLTCKEPPFKRGKKDPRKVVWYFPLIPHLQRYFADTKEAKHMTWHKTRTDKNDGILRHIADGCRWKALDCIEPEFTAEPRNPRLGVSTDRLNPFGNQSSTHSTWPVFVWMYNLPLALHETEVHTHGYANSRANPTRQLYQHITSASEGGARHIMGE